MVRQESEQEGLCILLVNSKSSDEPFDRLDRRHQPEAATCEAKESLNATIQFLILSGCKLGAILVLALLAEDSRMEGRKTSIQLTELLESLDAGGVKSLVALGSGNSRLPD
jgi:hypothetical protein